MLIVANWKMNGCLSSVHNLTCGVVNAIGASGTVSHGIEGSDITQGLASPNNNDLQRTNSMEAKEVVLCPSYVHLDVVSRALKVLCKNGKLDNSGLGITVGAQDVSTHQDCGAYTGQVSASMISDLGCKYSIIGHSECRACGQSNEMIASKVNVLRCNDITPIVCVGESSLERSQNSHKNFILKQLDESIASNGSENLVIAYEPIWAIGSGCTPSLSEIKEIAQLIKFSYPSSRFLYGGSVTSQNSSEIINVEGIDGLLVGGSSLIASEFAQIVKNCL